MSDPTDVQQGNQIVMASADDVAKATEKARMENDKWADKIKQEDGIILNMGMSNYQDWFNFFQITTRKRKCELLLTKEPNTTPLEKNNALNIALLLIKFIDNDLY